jgi:hypothetical protein
MYAGSSSVRSGAGQTYFERMPAPMPSAMQQVPRSHPHSGSAGSERSHSSTRSTHVYDSTRQARARDVPRGRRVEKSNPYYRSHRSERTERTERHTQAPPPAPEGRLLYPVQLAQVHRSDHPQTLAAHTVTRSHTHSETRVQSQSRSHQVDHASLPVPGPDASHGLQQTHFNGHYAGSDHADDAFDPVCVRVCVRVCVCVCVCVCFPMRRISRLSVPPMMMLMHCS